MPGRPQAEEQPGSASGPTQQPREGNNSTHEPQTDSSWRHRHTTQWGHGHTHRLLCFGISGIAQTLQFRLHEKKDVTVYYRGQPTIERVRPIMSS